MAIKGHKERALLRRGYQVQEALKRRPMLNETSFLRRSLISESIDVVTELAGDCEKNPNNPYCKLKFKLNSLGDTERKDLLKKITIIFNFFTKELNNSNTTVFQKIISSILNLDAWQNAITVTASALEKGSHVLTSGEVLKKTKDRVRDALNNLINSNTDISEKSLDELLKNIRRIGYSEYERTFKGDNFDLIKGKWEMPNLDLDIKSFWKVILKIYKEKTDPQKLINHVVDTIIKNKHEIFETAKADLFLKRSLYVGEKEVIPANTHIEVKKMDYTTDSYMSEFYAIYKDSALKEKLNNLDIDQEEFLKLYNKIIDGIYLGLLEQSNNIIEEAENHIFGIIYDKNILVPRLNEKGEKNFKFYWSNKGQRACDKDHRLSIRFRPLKETIVGYQYDTKTHSNQLKLVELDLDLRDDEGNFKKDITCSIT